MTKFLTRQQLFRLLQRELPPYVYPDGSEGKFYSTADMASIADVAATGYANLERINANYFPQTADERIIDWEIAVFGSPLDSSFTLEERRDRVLTKVRARKGITKQDMKEAVQAIIGSTKTVEIVPWGCRDYGWILGESELGIDTVLHGSALVNIAGPTICEDSPSDHGVTQEEWDAALLDAYTYEVQIFDYTLSAEERAEIDKVLTAAEPARSRHVITDGLTPVQ